MENKISEKEAGLRRAGELYGKEVEAALREYLSMIGEKFYTWMANLYLPRKCLCNNFDEDGNRVCLFKKDENGKPLCSGGGFYYSNSARDNDEYKIDIESTVQAIRFIQGTGMLNSFNRDLKKAFPKQMQLDVCAFAKSLQSSDDGYFYHEQWGKDIVPSRLGRDLGWATSILNELGDMPFYDTKNGYKGSLGAPNGNNSESGSDVPQTSTWVEHLRTLDDFKKYLCDFDLKTKSYPSGNQINAQVGQIKARDVAAIENGECSAENGFIATFRDIFNEQQNAENGLWEDEVHYNAVNGLMKISTSYNSLGLKFNYAEKAFDSAIEIALISPDSEDSKGKKSTGSVDVYNPWVSIGALFENVKRFGTEEELSRMKAKLKSNATELVTMTMKKAKKFQKDDGSFGYTWSYSPKVSQMAPVAVPNTVEGDINGGSIATNGIWRTMCSALEIYIPFFDDDDYEKFIGKIKADCNYK